MLCVGGVGLPFLLQLLIEEVL